MKNHLSGSFIATGCISNACTAFKREPLSSLFSLCHGAMLCNDRVFLYGDRLIAMKPHWIRDYMLTLKGFKYTEKELTSFPDLLFEHQHESGFFYEIVAPVSEMHGGQKKCGNPPTYLVEEPYRWHEPGNKFGLVRLELEADVEYLMVEGSYQIWQATGDDEWLAKRLPQLEKGLRYSSESPVRWDKNYRMMKRPHTLDTWDFTDRLTSAHDRMIRPEDPMGIFHGDNTGLYYAKQLMAKMYRYFGDEKSAARQEEEAEDLRKQVMKYLWNGKFFRHFLMLDPADYGVDETWQMSLSNSYALNRGILTLDQKKSVLAAYRACREKYKGELDDFRNLEPPLPKFMIYKAGDYVDGGVAPFVAGQLSQAAFESGEEEYGTDILDRIGCKFLRDGKVSFLYDWNGQDCGGGPRCWCGAEIMNAMTMGLAGVRDETKQMEEVTISPRFAAAGEDHAYVRLEYAATGAACEYEWSSDDGQKQASFRLFSGHKKATLRMYAPKGMVPVSAEIQGQTADMTVEKVGESSYAVLRNVPKEADVRICFR